MLTLTNPTALPVRPEVLVTLPVPSVRMTPLLVTGRLLRSRTTRSGTRTTAPAGMVSDAEAESLTVLVPVRSAFGVLKLPSAPVATLVASTVSSNAASTVFVVSRTVPLVSDTVSAARRVRYPHRMVEFVAEKLTG